MRAREDLHGNLQVGESMGSKSLDLKICESPDTWSLDENFSEWELVIASTGLSRDDHMARGNVEQRHSSSLMVSAKPAKQVRQLDAQ